jgi:hypothetical protein
MRRIEYIKAKEKLWKNGKVLSKLHLYREYGPCNDPLARLRGDGERIIRGGAS